MAGHVGLRQDAFIFVKARRCHGPSGRMHIKDNTRTALWRVMGRRGKGCPTRIDHFDRGQEQVFLEKAAAAMALRAACSGTHTRTALLSASFWL